MSLGTILLILLVLVLVGAIPTWPHSRSWGYAPSGVLGLLLLIVVVLLLLGRLEHCLPMAPAVGHHKRQPGLRLTASAEIETKNSRRRQCRDE